MKNKRRKSFSLVFQSGTGRPESVGDRTETEFAPGEMKSCKVVMSRLRLMQSHEGERGDEDGGERVWGTRCWCSECC